MLKMYRADRKGNKTSPEKFYTEGLLTKQLNSGDNPLPHIKYGWIKTIISHIYYVTQEEQFIYNTTQYLSFTTDYNRALFFLTTENGFQYHKVDRDNAEAFIFTALIDESELVEISEGLFIYSYKCNYDKTKNDPKFQSSMAMFIRCNICSINPNYKHKLLLINTVKYLEAYKNIYPIEYEFAMEDKEWLLMPLDLMLSPTSLGFQSRIQIADFWTADFYKYDS